MLTAAVVQSTIQYALLVENFVILALAHYIMPIIILFHADNHQMLIVLIYLISLSLEAVPRVIKVANNFTDAG